MLSEFATPHQLVKSCLLCQHCAELDTIRRHEKPVILSINAGVHI